jgi:biotin transport system substrate-specific component
VDLPGTEVPQTAQTLAVLLAGALLGPLRGSAAVALYLALGAVGLPVLAGGAGGMERLVGPTGGFLAGFLAAAVLVGVARRRGWLLGWFPALGVMVAGHALILALGWARLAFTLGGAGAWDAGVAPFVAGGAVKSAVAVGVVVPLLRSFPPPANPGEAPGDRRGRAAGGWSG